MNVLFLSLEPPDAARLAGRGRLFHLMREARREHDVVSLSYGDDRTEDDVRQGLCDVVRRVILVERDATPQRAQRLRSLLSTRSLRSIRHRDTALQRALDEVLREEPVDVLFVASPRLAGLEFPPDVPVVVDAPAVQHLRRPPSRGVPPLEKLCRFVEWHKRRREEIACFERARLVTVPRDRDRSLLIECSPWMEIEVLPNGVDADCWPRSPLPPEPGLTAFVGDLSDPADARAVEWFVEWVLPRVEREVPEARFVAVGGTVAPELERLRSERVELLSDVDDVQPHLRRAGACVLPQRADGETPFDVVAGLASGRPLVSTGFASDGVPVTHGAELLIADTPQDFAEAVIQLLHDPVGAAQIASAGRRFVEEHCAWEQVGLRLNTVLTAARASEVYA